MDRFLELLTNLNDFMWTYFLIGLVIVTGIYFTFSTKFVQFTYIKEMFRLIMEKPKVGKGGEQKGVSAFQAFTISAASRVGTGTIAGVAIAIAMGGPGSVFWMWVMALFGGASSFAESTLAQVYKVRDRKGVYRGGPAYYMEKGLGQKWMGVLFAIVISITYGIAFNSVQTNTIAQALQVYDINPRVAGIALLVLTIFVVFGGVTKVVKITQWLVPVMAVLYLFIVLVISDDKNEKKIIRRHINADCYDEARLRRISKEGKLLYKRRKETIERSFADSKQNHGYRYAQYRGKAKVQSYAWLSCCVQNMKTIALREV